MLFGRTRRARTVRSRVLEMAMSFVVDEVRGRVKSLAKRWEMAGGAAAGGGGMRESTSSRIMKLQKGKKKKDQHEDKKKKNVFLKIHIHLVLLLSDVFLDILFCLPTI